MMAKRRAGTYLVEVRLDKIDCPPRGVDMSLTLDLPRGQDPHIIASALGRHLVAGDYMIDGPEGYEPGNAIIEEAQLLRAELFAAKTELAALKGEVSE